MVARRWVLAALGALVLPLRARASVDPDLLALASRYFDGIETAEGTFEGDGGSGRFAMRRPGRLRIDVLAPSPLTIVADGTWLAVLDRQTNTLDRRLLSRSPFSVLLADPVDLSAGAPVAATERQAGLLRLVGQGVASDVTVELGTTPFALRRIGLPGGGSADIRIERSGRYVDPRLFVLEEGSGDGPLANSDRGRG